MMNLDFKAYGFMAVGAVIFFAGMWSSWNIAFNMGYIKCRLTRMNNAPQAQERQYDPQGHINPFGQTPTPDQIEDLLGSDAPTE